MRLLSDIYWTKCWGFAEAIINRILDDLVKACSPKEAAVTGLFTPRGGISIKVEACYSKAKKKGKNR